MKAGRPKKGSAGLPEWFDIEKYRPLKSFKTADWFEQLAFRKSLFDYARYLNKDKKESVSDALNVTFSLLKADPVITRERIVQTPFTERVISGEKHEILDRALGFSLWNMISSGPSIRDIGYSELQWLGSLLPDEMRTALVEHLALFLDNIKITSTKIENMPLDLGAAQEFLRSLFTEMETPVATIDLSLPDEALIAEFKDYLKNWRKRLGKVASPFYKNPDFNGWYNSGVLPYLDLQLWEIATGEAIRWSAFTEAMNRIADRPVGGEGALRKTTQSHAKKLMDVRTLRVLQSQVGREKSGTIKQSGKLIVR